MGESAKEKFAKDERTVFQVYRPTSSSLHVWRNCLFAFQCWRLFCLPCDVAFITTREVFLVKFCFLESSTYVLTNKSLGALYPRVTISVLCVHIYTCIDAPMNNELWKCVHKDIERDNTWQWAVNALSFPRVRDNCIIHEWQRKVTSVNCIWAT